MYTYIHSYIHRYTYIFNTRRNITKTKRYAKTTNADCRKNSRTKSHKKPLALHTETYSHKEKTREHKTMTREEIILNVLEGQHVHRQ